jgi:hypothetical protein
MPEDCQARGCILCDTHVIILLPVGRQHVERLAEGGVAHAVPHVVVEVLRDVNGVLGRNDIKKLRGADYELGKILHHGVGGEGFVPETAVGSVHVTVPCQLCGGLGFSKVVPGAFGEFDDNGDNGFAVDGEFVGAWSTHVRIKENWKRIVQGHLPVLTKSPYFACRSIPSSWFCSVFAAFTTLHHFVTLAPNGPGNLRSGWNNRR